MSEVFQLTDADVPVLQLNREGFVISNLSAEALEKIREIVREEVIGGLRSYFNAPLKP